MGHDTNNLGSHEEVTVLDLSKAPGERTAWDKPKAMVYLWAVAEMLFVTNPWQISSSLRVTILRLFGARIGPDVIFRPRTRVKFPWKLQIGARSWIGEGVWFHNQDEIHVGSDVVISQESFLTTGSHSHRTDMGLVTLPIWIADGTWITSRCMILGGSHIGTSCLITPMSLVKGTFPPNRVISGNPAVIVGLRFTE